MIKRLIIFLYFLLILLIIFIRFYQIESIPPALYQDESAIGYNAYSILKTGLDEHGLRFPLYFKSFGDYKMPVYIYITSIFIKIFGVNEFSVRLPSVLAGFFSLFGFSYLIYLLTKNKFLSLLGLLILGFCPQHIFFSRAAFEVNLALFFVIYGLIFFFLGIKNRPLFFLFFLISFGLAFYTYNVMRFSIPLMILFLIFWKRREIYSSFEKKYLITFFLIIFIIFLPFFVNFFKPGGVKNSLDALIFSKDIQSQIIELRSYLFEMPQIYVKLFFNKYLFLIFTYFKNIVSVFSAPFYFVQGTSHGSQGLGDYGYFHLIEFPLFILGLISFFKMKNKKKDVYILFLFLIIIAIAALSLSKEVPHATRGYLLLLPSVFLITLGFEFFLQSINKLSIVFKNIIIFCFLIAFFYNLNLFLANYFFKFPVVGAYSWRRADKELALFLQEKEKNYDQIIIDEDSSLAYTSLLFYQRYDPLKFIFTAKRKENGLITVQEFGKYKFEKINFTENIGKKTLFIVDGKKSLPDKTKIIYEIYNPQKYVVLKYKDKIVQYPFREKIYQLVEFIN